MKFTTNVSTNFSVNSPSKFLKVFGLIFAIIGFFSIISTIGIFIGQSSFKKGADVVDAVISDIAITGYHTDSDGDRNAEHTAYVDYKYKGEYYEHIRLNYYSSSMYIGQEIEIYCKRDNPTRIQAKSMGGWIVFIPAIIGIVFMVVGISVMVSSKKVKTGGGGSWSRPSFNQKLADNGSLLYATVEGISYGNDVQRNGQFPWVIYTSYINPATNAMYTFKSDNLWTDPAMLIQPGDKIGVYVEPSNYNIYHVDIEGLLQGRYSNTTNRYDNINSYNNF